MPTSLLEIVDLGDGEIVLQRAEEDQSIDFVTDGEPDPEGQGIDEDHGLGDRNESREPLVTIRFSDETRMYIMDQSLEVAKAMIQAGIQAAAQLAEQAEVEIEATSSMVGASRVLH